MDDNEIKSLLKKNLVLAQENNKMLKKMRRSARIAAFFRVVWWIILLGGPVLIYYYYLQPYVEQFFETYQSVSAGIENVEQAGKDLPILPDGLLDLFHIGGEKTQ